MQNSKILIAAIVLMAFGGGFGAALLLEFQGPAQSARETAPEPAAIAPSKAKARDIPEAAPRPEPVASSGDFRAHFRAGVQAMPREERERGKGVIQGLVRTETGEVVPGVQLQLQATAAPEFQEEDDLVGFLTRMAFERRWREAQTHETVTDASGRYRFEDLPDHAFRLTATHDDYVVEHAQGSGGPAIQRPDATVDWIAKAAKALTFEVVDENGNPVKRAIITATTGDPRSGLRSWPLHTGSVPVKKSLKHGTYTLWASEVDRHLHQSAATTIRITVDANTPMEPIRLVIPQTGTLNLRCTLNGRPLASQSLSLAYKLLKKGEEPNLAALANPELTRHSRFLEFPTLFQSLPYGTYVVGLNQRFGEGILAWRVIEVTKPREDIDWPIELPSDLSLLEIVAEGPLGEAVLDLKFRYDFQSDTSPISGNLNVLHADGGRYTCTPDRKLNGSGRITVLAEHEVFGSGTASADWPSNSPLQLKLSAFADLELQIPGIRARGQDPGFQLRFHPIIAGRSDSMQRMRVLIPSEFDEADRMVIPKLPAGDYVVKLLLNRPHGYMAGYGISIGQFTLHPGANRESIPFPVLSQLIVLPAPGGALPERLTLRPYHESETERWTLRGSPSDQAAQTRITFELVPHGRYSLEGRPKEGVPQVLEVKISGDTTVTWPTMEFDAIRIVITAENSPLLRAGLADGDLILAVANVELTTKNLQQSLFTLTMAEDPLALRIHRGGRVIDLTADMTEVRRQSRNLGGRLLPAKR